MGGVVKVEGRDVRYEGPFVRIGTREIPYATPGSSAELEVVKGDVPTFAALAGAQEIQRWWPDATQALWTIVATAIAGDPDDPTLTPEERLQAIRASWATAGEQLLALAATAIVASTTTTSSETDVVEKASPSLWAGLL